MLDIGIIGAGQNAAGHARYYHDSPRARVAAVADVDLGRARALADECGGARAVADYRDLLGTVDAVVVASPNRFHREQCLAACDAGLPVYCEKPVGLSGDDAAEMAGAARRAGVASAVGFSVRLHPTIQTLFRLHDAGDLGDLVSCWSRRLMAIKPGHFTGWRADTAQTGGLLLEINVHEIDWMMRLAGPVARVFAATRATMSSGPRANDHLWVHLDFERGAKGTHEGSWAAPTANFFRGAYGTSAGAQTDEWGGELRHTGGDGKTAKLDLDAPFDLRAAWLDAAEGGPACECDLDWGVQVMRVCDAIFASAESGRPVDLAAPPA